MHHHIIPMKVYLGIYFALLALTLATVGVSYLPVDAFAHLVGAIFIATIKTVLIVLVFMHVKYNDHLIKAYAGVGFVGLIVFLIFMFGDYISKLNGLSPSTSATPFDIF